MINNVAPQAVDDVPERVVDGSAVQHHHVQWNVSPEEQDFVAKCLVRVNTGGEVLHRISFIFVYLFEWQ